LAIAKIQGEIMTSITGGCLCGRVRYAVIGEPARSGLCHCRDCQRSTGSAFEPVMIFPTASVSVQGELKTFDMPGGSGQAVHRRFCSNCGSGVFIEADTRPGLTIIAVGTLDDPTVFVPTFEVYCDAAQPWVNGGSERKRFPKGLT
jgi:hypothetical protein